MTFVYPNTISKFIGNREIAISSGYIEVEDSVYADLVETKKMWQDGEIVDDPTYEARKAQEDEERRQREAAEAITREVESLKADLVALDYKTIKYVQGKLTQEEFDAVINVCEQKRARINELENSLQEQNH